MILDPHIGDDLRKRITLRVPRTTGERALELILLEPDLGYVLTDGAIFIMTKERLR